VVHGAKLQHHSSTYHLGKSHPERAHPDGQERTFGIVAGADGALWFTEAGGNKIGRITADGKSIMEFPVPKDSASPMGIAAGPDGARGSSNKLPTKSVMSF
jgi:streptogramin lyase